MERTATSLIDKLKSQNPSEIIDALEFLSYCLWTRNSPLLACLVDLQGHRLIVNLLQPQKLNHLPKTLEKIQIKLHYSSSDPSVVYDTWKHVIRGMAAEVLSRMFSGHSKHLEHLVQSEIWLLPVLVAMFAHGNDLERIGACRCLDRFMASAAVREAADMDRMVESVWELIYSANQEPLVLPVNSPSSSLFGNIRWKLAAWRTAFDLLTTLAVEPGWEIHSHKTSVVPFRHDWKVLARNGGMAAVLVNVLKFAAESARCCTEAFGTVFSGPGIFKNTAIQVSDISSMIRSVIFLLHKLALHDLASKSYIIRQEGVLELLKSMGCIIQGQGREDLVALLVFLGMGAQMSQVRAETVHSMLTSKEPRRIFRSLKILAHTCHLLDGEQLSLCIKQYSTINILLAFMRPSSPKSAHHRQKTLINTLSDAARNDIQGFKNAPLSHDALDESVGERLLIQRDPLRDAVTIPSSTTWRSLFRAFGAHIFGRIMVVRAKESCKALSLEKSWFYDTISTMTRSSSDIERWGGVTAMQGYAIMVTSGCSNLAVESMPMDLFFVDKHTCLQSLMALIAMPKATRVSNGRMGKERFAGLFCNENDYQWRFEAWHSCVDILSRIIFSGHRLLPELSHRRSARNFNLGFESVRLTKKEAAVYLSSLTVELGMFHQVGLVPQLFSLLKFIVDLHHPDRNCIADKNQRSPAFHTPAHLKGGSSFHSLESSCHLLYTNDNTLPSLIYDIFRLIFQLSTVDAASFDMLLWREHLHILGKYAFFCDANVREMVRKIFNFMAPTSSNSNCPKPTAITCPPHCSLKSEKSARVGAALGADNNECIDLANNDKFAALMSRPSLNSIEASLLWPAHLAVNAEDMLIQTTDVREVKSLMVLKTCNNVACLLKETRKDQFIACSRCQPLTWYCSRSCMHMEARDHAFSCRIPPPALDAR